MKATQKLSELTDLAVVQNPKEVKGGFFFFLLSHFKAPAYHAPAYEAPKNDCYGKSSNKGGKKGY